MEPSINIQFDITYFAPFLTVCIFALLLLVLPAMFRFIGKTAYEKNKTPFLTAVTLIGLLYALGYAVFVLYFLSLQKTSQSGFIGTYLYSAVIMDSFSFYFQMLTLLSCLLAVILSYRMLVRGRMNAAAYLALLLLSASGAMVMSFANDLLVVFLGLELLSIPLYVLCGFKRKEVRSLEASMKYLLMGAFASAFFVYGIALVFASAGTTNLSNLFAFASQNFTEKNFLFYTGAVFLITGFAFKIALVPFHAWVPDVYEGAPVPITAYMATAVKAAGFAPLLRVFMYAFSSVLPDFFTAFALISVLTMTVGNVVALFQSNFKRMLAYSSISHAGVLLLGLLAAQQSGLPAMMFYLLAYTFATIGSFALISCFSGGGASSEFASFSGRAAASPFLSVCAVTFMFSLTGIPPTAGFIGKLLVFSSLVRSDLTLLAAVALINSVISAFYYLRLPVALYMQENNNHETPQEDKSIKENEVSSPSRSEMAVVFVCFAGTLFFGVAMSPLLSFLNKSMLLRLP